MCHYALARLNLVHNIHLTQLYELTDTQLTPGSRGRVCGEQLAHEFKIIGLNEHQTCRVICFATVPVHSALIFFILSPCTFLGQSSLYHSKHTDGVSDSKDTIEQASVSSPSFS